MSRYIDADALIERCERLAKDEYNQKVAPFSWADAWVSFIDDLVDEPTADVVEVVRCKDCKHYISPDRGYPYCSMMSNKEEGEYYTPVDDHYCSYGERREE